MGAEEQGTTEALGKLVPAHSDRHVQDGRMVAFQIVVTSCQPTDLRVAVYNTAVQPCSRVSPWALPSPARPRQATPYLAVAVALLEGG